MFIASKIITGTIIWFWSMMMMMVAVMAAGGSHPNDVFIRHSHLLFIQTYAKHTART